MGNNGMGKTEIQCLNCFCVNCRCEELKAIHDEEMDAYRMSFEDFLAEKHAELFIEYGQAMRLSFEEWIDGLSAKKVAMFAEEYGKKCFKDGRGLK